MTATTTLKKTRTLDTEMLYDMLLSMRTADMVTLRFKDGRTHRGNLIFNQFKGSGRLINVEQELSLDFRVDELRDVEFK